VILAVSGTPGTGKSTVASILRSRGREVIDLGDYAKEHGLLSGFDEARGSYEVDPRKLDRALKEVVRKDEVLLIGHLSHLLTVDIVLVLRCRPSVLAERLRKRGWPEEKIRENMEAEACDVILVEALERTGNVLEIDTTALGPEETAKAVEEILAGEREKYAYGNIDWSEEVLDWF